MNNERYLRVSHEEAEHAHDDVGEEDVEHQQQQQFAWRPGTSAQLKFKSLAQDDEDDEDDEHEDDDLDQTTPVGEHVPIKSLASSHHGSNHGVSGASLSFDLDDDNDDLQRYQLDFSDNSMDRNLRDSTSLEASMARGQISLALLHKAYRQTQLETRRKRVDQLLSVTNESEKLWINACAWCDIYDRGLWVLLLVTGLWLGITTFLKQRLWTMLGVCFFASRLSAKPSYWYFKGRHIARKKKVTMQIYQEVNQLGSTELTPSKNGDKAEIV
jgi:hypothetical protein